MPQLSTPSRALAAPAALMAAILVGATAVACGSDSTTTPAPPTYVASLVGANEVPPRAVGGTGTATIVKTSTGNYTFTVTYSGMTGNLVGGHIHGPAAAGVNANVIVPFPNATGAAPSGTLTGTFTSTNTTTISNDSLDVLLNNGNAYVNLHTTLYPGGEIRGQLVKQ